MSYRALSSSAISYRGAVAGGTFLLSDDSTTCHVTWGDDYSGMVSVEALLPDSTVCSSQIQVILKDKPIAAPESGFGTLCLDGSSCDCSCKSRKSIKIPIISDNVSINGPDTLCLNNEYTFSLPLWGATLYSWSVTPSTGIYYSADNNNLTIIPQQHRAYTITATYSCSFLGCGPYTVTKEIVVKDPLSITPPSKEICVGANSSFSANTSSPSLWTIQLNDSTIHTVTAPALSYTFDTVGIFVIRASNRNYCSEAMATVNVKGNPPAPTAISGPDTVCPGFTAEYSATPSSTDYHILWEWTIDGTTHTHVGNKANITFGQTVDDIKVYQVNRRTGCLSQATTYHVAPFRIAEWPYDSLIRVCQGQTITLDKLRDQSGNDVLYEWKAYPAGALSVQGSHLNATVTLMANYSNDPPSIVMLVLKRVYCHTNRYDTVYVRIAHADSPASQSDTTLHPDAPPAIQKLHVRNLMCEHTAFTFLADATGEGLTYRWDFGDGYWNFGNGIDHVYGSASLFAVTLSVTDRNGRSATSTTSVSVHPDNLENYRLHQILIPACPEDSAILQTATGHNSYSWHPSSRSDDRYYASVGAAGTYIVDITSINEQCRKQVECNIPYPNGPFAAILCDSAYLQNEVAEFVGDIGPAYTYLWHIAKSGSILGSATTPNFSYRLADPGTYQLVLQVTDSYGCTATDTARIHVRPTAPKSGRHNNRITTK